MSETIHLRDLDEWRQRYENALALWRADLRALNAVKLLLEANGCNCDCDHDAESHDADCDRCLACRISWAVTNRT